MSVEHIQYIFLTLFFLQIGTQFYLSMRNRNYIHRFRTEVPAQFATSISLDEHQKAADYSITKAKFSELMLIINGILLLVWTFGGGLNILENITSQFMLGPISQGLIFFGIFSIISLLISLPESLYSTFVIEEKFGFNKTTPKIFIIDLVKQIMLGVLIGAPLLAGLMWIMSVLGTWWWFYGWVFLTAVQFTILWAYPKFIAPLFNKFSPLEDGDIKERVVQLLKKVQFSFGGLFVMNASLRSSHGNAYFTGFGKNKRIVFFDTLLKSLEPEEVTAVLAHELGHFKHKHILKSLLKSLVFSFIGFYILGHLLLSETFYQGHGVNATPSFHMGLMLFSMLSGIYTFFLTPVSSYTSRKNEFEADRFAAKYENPQKLVSALVKLYKENASTLTPDPVYSKFYHSHPPALERVEHLNSLS